MLCWRKNIVQLREDVSDARFRRVCVSSKNIKVKKEAWFAEAERAVFDDFENAREHGLVCSPKWFSVRMRAALVVLFPNGEADDFRQALAGRKAFSQDLNFVCGQQQMSCHFLSRSVSRHA